MTKSVQSGIIIRNNDEEKHLPFPWETRMMPSSLDSQDFCFPRKSTPAGKPEKETGPRDLGGRINREKEKY